MNTLTKEDIFPLEDVELGIKELTKGKASDIEWYQAEILKMGRYILIYHIHKLLNSVVKRGFTKPWMQHLIAHVFKSGDKIIPSNYRTFMINHILVKLYIIILEKKIILWLEIHGK